MKFAVIGLDSFGSQVAEALAENNIDVIAIDKNEQKIEEIRNDVNQSICINLADEDAIISLGLDETDGVIISSEDDFAQTVKLLRLLKKQYESLMVIVQGQNQSEKEILEIVGADQVIVPDQDSALRLADNLSPDCSDLIRVDNDFSIIQIDAPEKFINKTAKDLNILESYSVHYIARKQDGELSISSPDDTIKEYDVMLFAGKKEDLQELSNL
jgi:trk system potassium uptake protein